MKDDTAGRMAASSTTQIILTEAIEKDMAFRVTRGRLKIFLWLWEIAILLSEGLGFAAVMTAGAEDWTSVLLKNICMVLFYGFFALMMYGGARFIAVLPALGVFLNLRDLYVDAGGFLSAPALSQFAYLLLALATVMQVGVVCYTLFSPAMRHYEETMKSLSKKRAEESKRKNK